MWQGAEKGKLEEETHIYNFKLRKCKLRFLGGYADRESISKEINGIQQVMMAGEMFYELRFSVKVKRRLLGLSVIEE